MLSASILGGLSGEKLPCLLNKELNGLRSGRDGKKTRELILLQTNSVYLARKTNFTRSAIYKQLLANGYTSALRRDPLCVPSTM